MKFYSPSCATAQQNEWHESNHLSGETASWLTKQSFRWNQQKKNML